MYFLMDERMNVYPILTCYNKHLDEITYSCPLLTDSVDAETIRQFVDNNNDIYDCIYTIKNPFNINF